MMEMNKRMNNHKLKKYCTEYIRNCAILNHLNKIDAPWGMRRTITRELEHLEEEMLKELKKEE